MELVGILNALFEIAPFAIINAIIVMETGTVQKLIISSLLINCFSFGMVSMRISSIKFYIEARKRLLQALVRCRRKSQLKVSLSNVGGEMFSHMHHAVVILVSACVCACTD